MAHHHHQQQSGQDTKDTDQHQAVTLKHLSPTWVRWLDREAGRLFRRNGGYFDLSARFSRGRHERTQLMPSFMDAQLREDYQQHVSNDAL